MQAVEPNEGNTARLCGCIMSFTSSPWVPISSFFMCSCVLLSPGRFGPLRAEVVVGFRRVRLVQALLSSPSSAGLVPFSVGLRFSFPLPFQGCPFWARFHVLVFALSLFFCVPLSASWLSNFHLIVIFTSFSFPFFFIFISLSGPQLPKQPRGSEACVDHLKRCKTSNYAGGTAPLVLAVPMKLWTIGG